MLCSSVSYAKAEDVGSEKAGTVQMHVQMCVCFLTSASPFELTVEWEQRESHCLRYETASPSSPLSPRLRRAQAHLENSLTPGKCSFYLGFRVGLVVIERRTWVGKKILVSKERDVSRDNLPSLTSTLCFIIGLTEQGCLPFPPDNQMRLF